MGFQLIDFDEKFAEYMQTWMVEHRADYGKIEEMEADVPMVSLRWLNEPADWLDGKTPGNFFEDYTDGKELTDWMLAYMKTGISVPGPLLDRMAALGEAKPLIDVLSGELTKNRAERDNEVAMTCISLLMQMDSDEAAPLYIEYIIAQEGEDEVAEAAGEALCQLPQAREAMIAVLDRDMSEAARTAILDALVHMEPHPDVYRWLTRMFLETNEQKALYASFLGKYGNEDAIDMLKAAAQEPELNYLEYLEIRNAIEALGGECDIVRDFNGDKYFETMKGM